MTDRPVNTDLTLFRRKYYWQYALLIMALLGDAVPAARGVR